MSLPLADIQKQLKQRNLLQDTLAGLHRDLISHLVTLETPILKALDAELLSDQAIWTVFTGQSTNHEISASSYSDLSKMVYAISKPFSYNIETNYYDLIEILRDNPRLLVEMLLFWDEEILSKPEDGSLFQNGRILSNLKNAASNTMQAILRNETVQNVLSTKHHDNSNQTEQISTINAFTDDGDDTHIFSNNVNHPGLDLPPGLTRELLQKLLTRSILLDIYGYSSHVSIYEPSTMSGTQHSTDSLPMSLMTQFLSVYLDVTYEHYLSRYNLFEPHQFTDPTLHLATREQIPTFYQYLTRPTTLFSKFWQCYLKLTCKLPLQRFISPIISWFQSNEHFDFTADWLSLFNGFHLASQHHTVSPTHSKATTTSSSTVPLPQTPHHSIASPQFMTMYTSFAFLSNLNLAAAGALPQAVLQLLSQFIYMIQGLPQDVLFLFNKINILTSSTPSLQVLKVMSFGLPKDSSSQPKNNSKRRSLLSPLGSMFDFAPSLPQTAQPSVVSGTSSTTSSSSSASSSAAAASSSHLSQFIFPQLYPLMSLSSLHSSPLNPIPQIYPDIWSSLPHEPSTTPTDAATTFSLSSTTFPAHISTPYIAPGITSHPSFRRTFIAYKLQQQVTLLQQIFFSVKPIVAHQVDRNRVQSYVTGQAMSSFAHVLSLSELSSNLPSVLFPSMNLSDPHLNSLCQGMIAPLSVTEKQQQMNYFAEQVAALRAQEKVSAAITAPVDASAKQPQPSHAVQDIDSSQKTSTQTDQTKKPADSLWNLQDIFAIGEGITKDLGQYLTDAVKPIATPNASTAIATKENAISTTTPLLSNSTSLSGSLYSSSSQQLESPLFPRLSPSFVDFLIQHVLFPVIHTPELFDIITTTPLCALSRRNLLIIVNYMSFILRIMTIATSVAPHYVTLKNQLEQQQQQQQPQQEANGNDQENAPLANNHQLIDYTPVNEQEVYNSLNETMLFLLSPLIEWAHSKVQDSSYLPSKHDVIKTTHTGVNAIVCFITILNHLTVPTVQTLHNLFGTPMAPPKHLSAANIRCEALLMSQSTIITDLTAVAASAAEQGSVALHADSTAQKAAPNGNNVDDNNNDDDDDDDIDDEEHDPTRELSLLHRKCPDIAVTAVPVNILYTLRYLTERYVQHILELPQLPSNVEITTLSTPIDDQRTSSSSTSSSKPTYITLGNIFTRFRIQQYKKLYSFQQLSGLLHHFTSPHNLLPPNAPSHGNRYLLLRIATARIDMLQQLSEAQQLTIGQHFWQSEHLIDTIFSILDTSPHYITSGQSKRLLMKRFGVPIVIDQLKYAFEVVSSVLVSLPDFDLYDQETQYLIERLRVINQKQNQKQQQQRRQKNVDACQIDIVVEDKTSQQQQQQQPNQEQQPTDNQSSTAVAPTQTPEPDAVAVGGGKTKKLKKVVKKRKGAAGKSTKTGSTSHGDDNDNEQDEPEHQDHINSQPDTDTAVATEPVTAEPVPTPEEEQPSAPPKKQSDINMDDFLDQDDDDDDDDDNGKPNTSKTPTATPTATTTTTSSSLVQKSTSTSDKKHSQQLKSLSSHVDAILCEYDLDYPFLHPKYQSLFVSPRDQNGQLDTNIDYNNEDSSDDDENDTQSSLIPLLFRLVSILYNSSTGSAQAVGLIESLTSLSHCLPRLLQTRNYDIFVSLLHIFYHRQLQLYHNQTEQYTCIITLLSYTSNILPQLAEQFISRRVAVVARLQALQVRKHLATHYSTLLSFHTYLSKELPSNYNVYNAYQRVFVMYISSLHPFRSQRFFTHANPLRLHLPVSSAFPSQSLYFASFHTPSTTFPNPSRKQQIQYDIVSQSLPTIAFSPHSILSPTLPLNTGVEQQQQQQSQQPQPSVDSPLHNSPYVSTIVPLLPAPLALPHITSKNFSSLSIFELAKSNVPAFLQLPLQGVMAQLFPSCGGKYPHAPHNDQYTCSECIQRSLHKQKLLRSFVQKYLSESIVDNVNSTSAVNATPGPAVVANAQAISKFSRTPVKVPPTNGTQSIGSQTPGGLQTPSVPAASGQTRRVVETSQLAGQGGGLGSLGLQGILAPFSLDVPEQYLGTLDYVLAHTTLKMFTMCPTSDSRWSCDLSFLAQVFPSFASFHSYLSLSQTDSVDKGVVLPIIFSHIVRILQDLAPSHLFNDNDDIDEDNLVCDSSASTLGSSSALGGSFGNTPVPTLSLAPSTNADNVDGAALPSSTVTTPTVAMEDDPLSALLQQHNQEKANNTATAGSNSTATGGSTTATAATSSPTNPLIGLPKSQQRDKYNGWVAYIVKQLGLLRFAGGHPVLGSMALPSRLGPTGNETSNSVSNHHIIRPLTIGSKIPYFGRTSLNDAIQIIDRAMTVSSFNSKLQALEELRTLLGTQLALPTLGKLPYDAYSSIDGEYYAQLRASATSRFQSYMLKQLPLMDGDTTRTKCLTSGMVYCQTRGFPIWNPSITSAIHQVSPSIFSSLSTSYPLSLSFPNVKSKPLSQEQHDQHTEQSLGLSSNSKTEPWTTLDSSFQQSHNDIAFGRCAKYTYLPQLSFNMANMYDFGFSNLPTSPYHSGPTTSYHNPLAYLGAPIITTSTSSASSSSLLSTSQTDGSASGGGLSIGYSAVRPNIFRHYDKHVRLPHTNPLVPSFTRYVENVVNLEDAIEDVSDESSSDDDDDDDDDEHDTNEPDGDNHTATEKSNDNIEVKSLALSSATGPSSDDLKTVHRKRVLRDILHQLSVHYPSLDPRIPPTLTTPTVAFYPFIERVVPDTSLSTLSYSVLPTYRSKGGNGVDDLMFFLCYFLIITQPRHLPSVLTNIKILLVQTLNATNNNNNNNPNTPDFLAGDIAATSNMDGSPSFNFEQQNKAYMDLCLAFRAIQNINDRLRQNAYALLHFLLPPELAAAVTFPFSVNSIQTPDDITSSLSSTSNNSSSNVSNLTSPRVNGGPGGVTSPGGQKTTTAKIEHQRQLIIQQLCSLGFPSQDVKAAVEQLDPQTLFDTDYKSAVIAKIKAVHPTY